MTDFDMAEISAFKNTWSNVVLLLCTFHAISGQSKWIDKNTPKIRRQKLKDEFKELHFVSNEEVLRKKLASLKRFCTKMGLHNVKAYLRKSWEPFVAMWVQFFRTDFWSGQANTNNISEARISSFKRGLRNVTDGSIFSVVKYFLETYAPNDIQDFKRLNRDNS